MDKKKQILLIICLIFGFIAFKSFFSTINGLIGLGLIFLSFSIYRNSIDSHTGKNLYMRLILAGGLFCLGSILINIPLGILSTIVILFMAFLMSNIKISQKNVELHIPKIIAVK